jgi:ABC-type transport system involved in multi-copper enzyme maturation permease subunit
MTATAEAARAAAPDMTGVRVTQARVIASEWVKLRSLRSTRYTLAASVVITIGLGVLFSSVIAARWGTLTVEDRATLDTAMISLRGVYLAQLAIGVMGVMLITGEYATGMIRATLTSVPTRLPVLWAKLAVFGAIAVVISMAATLTAFLIGQAIFATKHAGVSLSDPGMTRVVLGAGLYLAVVGVLGMALGFIIRNTAGAISTLFGILLVLPILGDVLPASWAVHVVPYLPSNAGLAILQLHASPDSLAPWTGFALFTGYAAAAVLIAAIMLRRRDA